LSYMEQMGELYWEKEKHLQQYLEQVSQYEFYRELFPQNSLQLAGQLNDNRGNAIALEILEKGKARRRLVFDDLNELSETQNSNFVIMSPISYFGRNRTSKNARYLFAFAFDLDGVGMPQLRDVLHQMDVGILPKATFVVNSGTGLHLYYLLDEPIPMYPHNQIVLREVKYSLTRQIWNKFTSTIEEPQMQGVLQGFRMVGTNSKLGHEYPVTAYRNGDRVTLDQLLAFVPDSNGERQKIEKLKQSTSRLTLEQAKKKYPDWYRRRIELGERKGRWTVKRDLYDWWLHRIKDEIKVGHRYFGIMTLAIYARKCSIDEDELRQDAFELLELYDNMSVEETNRFTEDDIVAALHMYDEDYVTFPRASIERVSGLPIPANKRNWYKQKQHLYLARRRKEDMKMIGIPMKSPEGRPTSEGKVREWQQAHPTGRKADCRRDTGLDPKTIRKWWH
jgi:hypothetical protein